MFAHVTFLTLVYVEFESQGEGVMAFEVGVVIFWFTFYWALG